MKVTYHDPCHLGRLAEPHTPWKGVEKKVLGQLIITDPPREVRFGVRGVFDPPRNILKSIPGIEFKEMERIREYSWCCGSGLVRRRRKNRRGEIHRSRGTRHGLPLLQNKPKRRNHREKRED